jgi:hypothetical protein
MDKAIHLPRVIALPTLKWMAATTLGIAIGAGAMLVAYPFLFPPAVGNDAPPLALSTTPTVEAAAQGQAVAPAAAAAARVFRFDGNAPGRDPIHWANGTGAFVNTAEGWVLRLNGDFRSGPGPNFWIYLNTTAVGEERDFRADRGRVKLAALRSFEGAQNYRLPAGLDPSHFHTLTIWCETFGVYIASGALGAPPQTHPSDDPRDALADPAP